MADTKSIREKLLAAVSSKKMISINGVAYFGTLEKSDESNKVTGAVQAESDLTSTVRRWLKENNLNNLQSLEISGDATFVVAELTPAQQLDIELVVLSAAQAEANALPELINSKF